VERVGVSETHAMNGIEQEGNESTGEVDQHRTLMWQYWGRPSIGLGEEVDLQINR
jgi:hypothetical protein